MNLMFVVGCMILGYMAPELLVAFGRVNRVPGMMNILTSIAAGFISASFIQ